MVTKSVNVPPISMPSLKLILPSFLVGPALLSAVTQVSA